MGLRPVLAPVLARLDRRIAHAVRGAGLLEANAELGVRLEAIERDLAGTRTALARVEARLESQGRQLEVLAEAVCELVRQHSEGR